MRGFVPTPDHVVDLMVEKLFADGPPKASARVLDPGCGNGEFIAGVLRRCAANGWTPPSIVGIELDASRAATARRRFRGVEQVTIRQADFLKPMRETFDYVIGNPPYVSILALNGDERLAYRNTFRTAVGRFDLYVLFFEQALRLLAPEGRIVFITPEKFLYVETARPLRELLRSVHIEELHFAGEDTFADRVTYPLISTVVRSSHKSRTTIVRRDGSRSLDMINVATTWLPIVEGFSAAKTEHTLADISARISCGVATGADSVFVMPTDQVPSELRKFAHPTLSGRQITPSRTIDQQSSILAPYDDTGSLLAESRLGALGKFLREPARREQLTARSCAAHKPWYAFHDSFPLTEIRRPKILCKDITETPFFVVDRDGEIVPRHSVYYIVPADPNALQPVADYLNSAHVNDWLRAHCQRAAGGFVRLQSHVLKQIPIPASLAHEAKAKRRTQMELRPA